MRIGVQTFTIRKAQKKNIEKSYLPLINMGILDYEVARIKFSNKNFVSVACCFCLLRIWRNH